MATQPTRFKLGEGKISGYISIFLALLSFFAVFCFKFPEVLTSPEFREVYTGESMVILLTATIIASFFFAVLSFMLSHKKTWALTGLLISTAAIIIGGFSVQGRSVDKTNWHLGLDWLLLDLLLMAIIFVPIELVWPKNKEQTKFHEEWRTDLVYFVVSHLFIQFFGAISQQPAVLFFGWMGLTGLHTWVQSLPFVLELLLAFFITDFFQYWAHRFFHTHTYLWRFHSVHHSTKNMDWLAGSRTHFIDIFFTRAITFIPLYVLGFSAITFNTYIIFMVRTRIIPPQKTNALFVLRMGLFYTSNKHG